MKSGSRITFCIPILQSNKQLVLVLVKQNNNFFLSNYFTFVTVGYYDKMA